MLIRSLIVAIVAFVSFVGTSLAFQAIASLIIDLPTTNRMLNFNLDLVGFVLSAVVMSLVIKTLTNRFTQNETELEAKRPRKVEDVIMATESGISVIPEGKPGDNPFPPPYRYKKSHKNEKNK